MKIVAVTQARMTSTRLPGKILLKVGDQSLLEVHLSRIKQSKLINQLIVATTSLSSDHVTTLEAKKLGVEFFCGDEQDVLDRYYKALLPIKPDIVVRLTSDCPLIDPVLIDRVIQYFIDHNLDYCSNSLDPSFPDGQDVEVFKYRCLVEAWHSAKLGSEREHVTPYIWKNSSAKGGTIFNSKNYSEGQDLSYLRMTVDHKEDFEVIKTLINALGTQARWNDYAEFLINNFETRKINQSINRNEGYLKSVSQDEI